MSSPRSGRAAVRPYSMLLQPDELKQLLRTLAHAGVSSFSYEDAKVKLEIVRGSVRQEANNPQADDALTE